VTSYELTGAIVTERLVLRAMTEGDLDDIHAWMSDPDVARYQLYEPRTRADVAERLPEWSAARRLEKDGDYLQLAIELPGDRVIGCLYFKLTSLDNLAGEIGWALTADYHGKGYAFEAASAVLDLAFGQLGLHRVMANLDPRNAASAQLCERLGMRHEAHHVEDLLFKGAWADTVIYAILDREWLSR